MSARASRRQVLATIALQTELPMPNEVQFSSTDVVRLYFDRVAELRAWLPFFGIEPLQVSTQPYSHDDRTGTLGDAYNFDGWRGWPTVHLHAMEPADAPDVPIDDATREQLAAIAAGERDSAPAAVHRQVAGSCGAPGQCSAECSCGVVFDGFDTIAEADALLDNHIAAQAGAAC